MDLAWSDDLVAEARAARDEVAADLSAHGIPGDGDPHGPETPRPGPSS